MGGFLILEYQKSSAAHQACLASRPGKHGRTVQVAYDQPGYPWDANQRSPSNTPISSGWCNR